MKEKKTVSGFALLNVLLGVTLLTGIIFLIMHAMTNYHAEEKSRDIGAELAPIADTLVALAQDSTASATYKPSLCVSGGVLSTIPAGYTQSLNTSGIDVCGATVTITV